MTTTPDLFSAKELEIAELLAKGLKNKEIAQQLNIGTRTVEWHLSNIFSKLEVNNRTQAVILISQMEMVKP